MVTYLNRLASGLLDHVTVLIGIAVGGKAVAGVIYQPYYGSGDTKTGRVIWAVNGIGKSAWKFDTVTSDYTLKYYVHFSLSYLNIYRLHLSRWMGGWMALLID